jgi:hypothetical protein
MKKIVFASLLIVISTLAVAQTEPKTESVTITSVKDRIELPGTPYKIRSAEFNDVKGQYDLENGMTLTVSSTGRRMFAEMDNMSRAELVAAAPNIFVAKNKQMKITFEQMPNGNVGYVLVKFVAPQVSKGIRRSTQSN